MIQTLVFGLVTGAYLIVATLGFALVSRIEKFLNVSHAELISLGAFITYALNARADWPLPLAAAAAIGATALAAAVVSRLAFWPMRKTSPVVLLITSVGVLYVLHGVTTTAVTPGTYSYATRDADAFDLGAFQIAPFDLVVVAVAAVAVVGVHLILTRTTVGLEWRALASDESLALARGIDARRASVRLWLLVGALGGLAGVLLGMQGAITTDLAFEQVLLVLSVAILAGLGSVYGVVAAALILGVAMDMSTLVIPAGYREAVAFAVVLLVLIVRPQGLSGSRLAPRTA